MHIGTEGGKKEKEKKNPQFCISDRQTQAPHEFCICHYTRLKTKTKDFRQERCKK